MPMLSNKRLFQIHGWLGLNLGLLLFIVCFSGTIAVFSHELDWLLNPVLHVEPGDERVSWGTVHEAVRAAHPDSPVQWMHAPLGDRYAQEVVVETPAGQWRRVYVDPWTGVVQGDTSYFNVKRFFRSFHRRLFIYDLPWLPDSLYFVCFFGFVLLFAAVSGLLFYKKWWHHLFRLRWWKSRRVFWSDLHRLAGVWTLLFTVLIAVTGVWYFAEEGLRDLDMDNGGPPPTPRVAEPPTPPAPEAKRLPLDRLIEVAQAAYPSLVINQVYPPNRPNAPLRVIGQADAWLVRDRVNAVYVDPYRGEVLDVWRGEDLALLPRWANTADPLHFGTFGGLAAKIIWFVLGLALSGSILAGGYLWYARTQAQAPPLRTRLWAAASHVFAAGLLLLTAYRTYYGILDWGPSPDGTVAPRVAWGGTLFIAGFIVVTLGIIAVWYRLVFARIVGARRGRGAGLPSLTRPDRLPRAYSDAASLSRRERGLAESTL